MHSLKPTTLMTDTMICLFFQGEKGVKVRSQKKTKHHLQSSVWDIKRVE